MARLKQQLSNVKLQLQKATASSGISTSAQPQYGPGVAGNSSVGGAAVGTGGGAGDGKGGAAWRRWRSIDDFPRDRPLFVTFSNAHYSDLMLNWVEMLRVLDVRPHHHPPLILLLTNLRNILAILAGFLWIMV